MKNLIDTNHVKYLGPDFLTLVGSGDDPMQSLQTDVLTQ